MKLVFSFFLFFINLSYGQCQLSKKYEFISLSSSVTSLLRELKLLNDPQLKYVSSYHRVIIEKQKKISGGVFLSDSKLKELTNGFVFFDESLSLKKIIEKNNIKHQVIISKNQDPFELVLSTFTLLKPYLENCQDKVRQLKVELKEIKSNLKLFLKNTKKKMVFFLGKISKNSLPDLIIANDGAMKFLKEYSSLNVYPSTLAYLPWSQKIIKRLPLGTLFIGLEDAETSQIEKLGEQKINITYPGVLSPGWFQIDFLVYLMNNFE